MKVDFGFACPGDIPALKRFIADHWRAGHVLSQSDELWIRDFARDDHLTVGVARDSHGELAGIFGYIPYSSDPVPDIAGSLWRVTSHAQRASPMLGIRLRQFVVRSVPHRVFGAPGANVQTREVYRMLRMNWSAMDQLYWINPDVEGGRIATVPVTRPRVGRSADSGQVTLHRLTDPSQLDRFPFERYRDVAPFKDRAYVAHRFFGYPYAAYDVHALEVGGEWSNLVVTRRVLARGSSALRVVDYYGSAGHIGAVLSGVSRLAAEMGDEYADFVCLGMRDQQGVASAGWATLDLARTDVVIPNLFDPFVAENRPIYCVWDPTSLPYRQFKADGDQDRPNSLPPGLPAEKARSDGGH